MSNYRVLGLMSGTSLDGVDLAHCILENTKGRWRFKIERAETIPYSGRQRKDLSAFAELTAEKFAEGHVAYGKLLGNLSKDFLKRNRAEVDFVASHGHTIFHQPRKGFTTQIGDGAALSAACGLPVVCDFRSADVALGGQGAPLVPIGDQLLFSRYECCLNLGGIANVSFQNSGRRIAYDICPVNIVLNDLASEKGKRFDKGGMLARQGKVNNKLLDRLNAVSFYKRSFPKSLGREDIEKYIFGIIRTDNSTTEDRLRTFCEHIAIQISLATRHASGRILVTGGGAYHSFLISRIREHCSAEIVIPEKQIIEFKEALIFAFLGVLRWRNEINCLSSVTGALRDSCGGAIYNP